MHITAIAPEIFLAGMGCIILMAEVFTPENRTHAYGYSLLTLLVTAALIIYNIPMTAHTVFDNSYIVDKFACGMKLISVGILAAIFIYSKFYMQSRDFFKVEFFVLTLFSLLGMILIISSNNFLTLYLGIELFVLPLYALIVIVKHKANYTEAAFKYFIIGSLGSSLLLFGISLIYGAVGSIDFQQVAMATNSHMFTLGMMLIVSGMALEFGAVPFHMWLPDVYEGSPTTVTMIVGTIPKVAIFAVLYRLLSSAFINISPNWQLVFMLLGVLSVIFGNLFAIVQKNVKRFLAYSTISHVGFILLGLFAAPKVGFAAPIFYTIVYAIMVLAAFALIIYLSHQGFEADEIDDFKGLAKREPWLSFLMLLTMFSLAGIPPLVGFYAKLQILQSVIDAGYAWLAIVVMLFSVIGAFYYLRVVKNMYFEEPVELNKSTHSPGMSVVAKTLVSGHSILLLLLGLYPTSILYMCIAMLQ